MADDNTNWLQQHIESYLRTDGREGHLFDLEALGFEKRTPTLLLKTIGRKSSQPRIVPLIYLPWGDEYVVIGSKGGSPEHPDWFLNLSANPDIAFQIGGKRWQATFRLAEGLERQDIWDYAVGRFAPYGDYAKTAQGRQFPVLLLKPGQEIPSL